MRSPFAPIALALVALIAALARWGLQGSRNVWTLLARKCWIADPDVGWAISDRHPIWLGLEAIGIVAGIAAGLAVGGWIIRRRERKTGERANILRAAAWVAAAVALAVPIAAFATGFGAEDCRDVRPASVAAKVDGSPGGAAPIS
ncbi:MAG TPA: hypothetical protein VN253_15100, partial [Kofleriaceae bacterium]|nr:hypothetical protein [Kofleriaceae bacterium]